MVNLLKSVKLIVAIASISAVMLLQSCAETEIEKMNKELKEFIWLRIKLQ